MSTPVRRGPIQAIRRRRPARGARRLAAAERRAELLAAAAEIMTARGLDAIQFAEVAAVVGVTRPLVYRFFASRQALIVAVLEDFAAELTLRFGRGAMRSIPGSNAAVARVFVEAVCDTIESRGAGPWRLLDANGPDPELARVADAIMERLLAPWQMRIAEATGASTREARTLARMIVAAGRAVLELWCTGELTRDEAVRDTTRGVSALVEGFSRRADERRLRTTPPERRRGAAGRGGAPPRRARLASARARSRPRGSPD